MPTTAGREGREPERPTGQIAESAEVLHDGDASGEQGGVDRPLARARVVDVHGVDADDGHSGVDEPVRGGH